jgi:hypothetical protein
VFTKALVTAVVVAPIIAVAALAQQSGIKRTPLQTVDFPAGYNVVSVMAEIPSGCARRHTDSMMRAHSALMPCPLSYQR